MPQAVVAGAHVEGFFPQHVRHGAAERGKGRVLQHLQLELAVAIDKVGVGEEIHPVVDIDVESAEQTFVFEGTALKHLLGFNFAGVAKVIEQERAHLPAVTHFFDHDPRERAAIPVSGRGFEQVPLLLDAGEFGVALVDDHVEQGVAHLLRGNLAEVLPLAISLEVAELDFLGFDGSIESVEMEAGNLVTIDADFFAPFVEEALPLAEGSDFCDFAWHTKNLSTAKGTAGHEGRPNDLACESSCDFVSFVVHSLLIPCSATRF